MYKAHTSCRACGLGKPSIPTLKESCAAGPAQTEQSLIPVLDLGLQPLANDFVDGASERAGFAPLKVMYCPRCTLAQLSVVVNPSQLYKHYSYVTGHSVTMLEHFRLLVDDIRKEVGKGSVVEIGSNDGTLLDYMKNSGFGPVLGIDPAENLDKEARAKNINTICNFFCYGSAHDAVSLIGQPDVVIGRHVFCHINDWAIAIQSLELLCKKETLICIEVPHAKETVRNGQFDQIYHEHLSYLSIKSLEWALKNTKLHIHDVKKYTIHGGSIVVMLRRNDSQVTPKDYETDNIGVEEWRLFAQKSEINIIELGGMVRNLASQGKTVVGYGASAKSTVWINACNFTRKEVKWICDDTPGKQYKLSPGTDIPITDPGALTRDLPDYAILFAWNWAKEIIEKEKIFRDKGCKWLIPVPKPTIV